MEMADESAEFVLFCRAARRHREGLGNGDHNMIIERLPRAVGGGVATANPLQRTGSEKETTTDPHSTRAGRDYPSGIDAAVCHGQC